MILNRILLKVENTEKMVSSYNKNENKSTELDKLFLSKFPIDNIEGFLAVETCILNDFDFVLKLVN
jgi:hypothetical protein